MNTAPASPRSFGIRSSAGAEPQARARHLPWLSIAIIGAFVVAGILAPWITPHDPYAPDLLNRIQPPSMDFPLGTDVLGRDVLTRMIFGARATLVVVLFAVASGALIGVFLGIVSGFMGGVLDAGISRAADSVLAFPAIFFGLLLAVTMGQGLRTVVIAVFLLLWARFARVIRGEVSSLREAEFVAQARIVGCSRLRIMGVHILPNVVPTATTLMSINMGYVILAEASLSFLGAGIPPPTPSWGGMISEGQNYLSDGWWISIFPGLAILLTILAFNGLGNWLRRRLDPKVRGEQV